MAPFFGKDPVVRKERIGLAVVVVVFAAIRLYAVAYGLRFEDASLKNYLQYIDPALLKSALLQSLYYLRDQPPLFNLFLGVILKAFPVHSTWVFQGVFLGVGLTLVVGTYLLMVRMRVAPALAVVVTIAFTTSPATLLYENWLFYTYPIAALLTLATLVLHRWLQGRRFRDALAFFSLLGLIVLTRGIFHLVWLLALIAALLGFCWRDRRQLGRAAALPLLLVVAFYVKTYLVFGGFVSGQMYQQVNLATMTVFHLPAAERKKLVKEGKLSPVTSIKVADYTDLHVYDDSVPSGPDTGIPMLDRMKKSSGFANWQYRTVPEVAALYGRDGKYVLTHYPHLYLQSVGHNLLNYFRPSSQSYPFPGGSPNAQKIAAFSRLHDATFGPALKNGSLWALIIAFPTTILFAALLVGRWLRRRRPADDAARALTTLFALFNILYISAVTILFSYGDHNRYRFKVTPLYCLLLAMLLSALWNRVVLWRRRSRQAKAPSPAAPEGPPLAAPVVESGAPSADGPS